MGPNLRPPSRTTARLSSPIERSSLDRPSTNHYSRHASPASAAALDVGRFAPYEDKLFANQAEEGAWQGGVGGTPTVLVAGIAVPANPEPIQAAVLELSS
jgi:hypothetical protein